MNNNEKLELALDLIDFCEGNLLSTVVRQFWIVRGVNLNDEHRRDVFLLAVSLLKANKR